MDIGRYTPDEGKRAGRMLAAGNLSATVTSQKTGQHITVKLSCKTRDAEGWHRAEFAEASHVFVKVPSPDGWGDRVGCYYPKTGRWFDADNADLARVWAAKMVIRWVANMPVSSQATIVEESVCGRCGRQLTDPISIERGIGPECYGKVTRSRHQHKAENEQSHHERLVREAHSKGMSWEDALMAAIEAEGDLAQTIREEQLKFEFKSSVEG